MARSDLFSAGVGLWVCLSGSPPLIRIDYSGVNALGFTDHGFTALVFLTDSLLGFYENEEKKKKKKPFRQSS